MLSVLSNGTLHLSEELSNARQESHRLRVENLQLLASLNWTRECAARRSEVAMCICESREKALAKRAAFLEFRAGLVQMHLRESRNPGTAVRGWWLRFRLRLVLCRWRRAAYLEQRRALEEQASQEHHLDNVDLHDQLGTMRQRTSDLEALLARERQRSTETEALLSRAREQLVHTKAQLAEAQSTLKDCYIRQFEETQHRQKLEKHVGSLRSEVAQLKEHRESLGIATEQQREDLSRMETVLAERQARLHEASEEMALVDEMIDDMSSSKVVGLKRFFEKYNLPGVLVSLFRKVLELQGAVRYKVNNPFGSQSSTSLPTALSSPSRSGSSLRQSGTIEAEIMQHMSFHGDGTVSRHELQVYVEALHLSHVSSSMVCRVVLALLGFDMSAGPCHCSKLIGALVSPPNWQDLELATTMWGAPAASVVEQRRSRAASASGRLKCSSSRVISHRAPANGRRQEE